MKASGDTAGGRPGGQRAAGTAATPPAVRAGLVLGALPVLFLLFDAGIKLARIEPVVQSFTELGWPVEVARGIGLLELGLVALHLVPRTAVLGALLLTGYLGGAVATHLRLGHPLLSHTLFPVYVGALLWAGLLLRDARVRELLPLRDPERRAA